MDSEKNPFGISIAHLYGPAPLEPVLHADARTLLERARLLLEDMHNQVQTMRCDAQKEAVRIRTEAAQLGEAERAACLRETRDACVQQGLQWLTEEARFEATLVERVEARLRTILVAVLRAWIDKQDSLTQLAHWLASQVRQRAQPSLYRIRLHPDERDALVARLMQEGAPENIECIADATLIQGQAVIETEFLRMEFDLARHWEQVLTALAHPAPAPTD